MEMPTKIIWIFSLLMIVVICLSMQGSAADDEKNELQKINKRFETLDHRLDQLEKAIDDILWYNKIGDIAMIDKVYQVGPPSANSKNPTAMGVRNPVKFWSYIFIPKNLDRGKKYPLLVLPHGGVHADFTTYYTHLVREMISQGYVVLAPEYRGSTGYGRDFYHPAGYCHESDSFEQNKT